MRLRVLSKRHKRFVGIFFIVLFLFLVGVFARHAAPVVHAFNGVRAAVEFTGSAFSHVVGSVFSQKAALLKENQDLTRQVQSLAIEQSAFDALQDSYDELTDLLAYTERSSFTELPAAVLTRSSAFEAQAILIDRGREDGVQVGQPVISGEGILIGVVTDARAYSSVVRLLSADESRIGGRLLNAEQTIGIVEGRDGALLEMAFIPQQTEIERDDVVVTSGLDEFIPSGLVIGTVSEVVKDEQEPFQQAFVQPLADVRRLHTAAVIIGNPL